MGACDLDVHPRVATAFAMARWRCKSPNRLEDGDPLNRATSSLLILLATGILISRSFKWDIFFSSNLALMIFLLFGLLSFLWSDFPLVSLKRWFRDLGNYLVILVVLSDRRPLEAVRALLRRLCYLLIPLSILLVRYYLPIGRAYSPWTGATEYVGVATSKNMLGVACLISGLFFFWDTVARWPNRKERRTRRIILVNAAFISMTLWLLNLSSSATSKVCLVLGCLVIAAAHSKAFQRRPGILKALIPHNFSSVLDCGIWPRDERSAGYGAVRGIPRLPTGPKYGRSFWLCTPIPSLAPATRASG